MDLETYNLIKEASEDCEGQMIKEAIEPLTVLAIGAAIAAVVAIVLHPSATARPTGARRRRSPRPRWRPR